jgi:hypothetical protein
MEDSKLNEDAKRATELLRGKIVSMIARHKSAELTIQFEDGNRLFVHIADSRELEISATGGQVVGI